MPTTLLQLRTRILERTDNQHTDGFVEPAEVDALVNLHYKALYALLQESGMHRAETELTVVATGATSYALPADLYAVFAVFRVESDGSSTYLTRHGHRVRPYPIDAPACTYRVAGALRLEFDTVPVTGTYTVLYIPVPAELVLDGDTVDGVLGWEEFIVLAAAVDIGGKEQIDPSLVRIWATQLDLLRARIATAARNAEMSESPCIAVVTTRYATDYDTLHRGVYAVRWPY